MLFQIKEIVLWPRNKTLEPRRVPHKPDMVNVITGASRTGKSAIIPIIDYCLGSGKCRIPVKTIRDYCEWFGIVVQTDSGEILFARREPGAQRTTNEMFTLCDAHVDIPMTIDAKNTTASAIKSQLDELAGLTNLDFDVEKIGSGFKDRPSFRDLTPFIFQPQNIVANPEVLFYKIDTYEHQEKLRTIFPYVLNATNPEVMSKQHELAELKKVADRKERELKRIQDVSAEWMASIHARISEAKELGLIRGSIPLEASRDYLIDLLKKVVSAATDEIRITDDTISEAVDELIQLQAEESKISTEISRLRKRFSEMRVLKDTSIQYQEALHIQRDRLKISEWVSQNYDTDHKCPLCGETSVSAVSKIELLCNSLKAIENEAGLFATIPPAFDREFERVRSDIQICSEKLKGIQVRRNSLEDRSSEARDRQYNALKVSRFIGNVEESLKTYSRIGEDGDLVDEIQGLRARIHALEDELKAANVADRTRRALQIISANTIRQLPYLDCESPTYPVSLYINDLTIKISSPEREDYLWEVGSGSNWISYHIAITLGLQEFFLSLVHSPVPGLVIYDQPSQVYFPRRLADSEEDEEPTLRDEDREAVRKIFKVLASAVEQSHGRLQVLVLDHAGDDVWGDIASIHCAGRWRDGDKLVPQSWLPES